MAKIILLLAIAASFGSSHAVMGPLQSGPYDSVKVTGLYATGKPYHGYCFRTLVKSPETDTYTPQMPVWYKDSLSRPVKFSDLKSMSLKLGGW